MRNEILEPAYSALKAKSTEELKQYAKDLIPSEDKGATIAFVATLTILEEERLTKSEYMEFVEYLHKP